MIIKLNNKPIKIETSNYPSLIEIARKEGYAIPSLCYGGEAKHKSSCMVCAVKNQVTGQIIPSCTTFPAEGMEIETESEDIKQIRILSLELLLADHRADCEAPCKMACPGGLDIAMMNRLYDAGKEAEALEFLRNNLVIPATLCYICNAPCEKICRRNDIDKTVPIREIKKSLVSKTVLENISKPQRNGKKVAVLGSGPAGLSAAYHLSGLGYDTTLFEPQSQALIPYIEAGNVPDEMIRLELDCIRKAGVEMVLSCANPLLDGFEGMISTAHENPAPEWIRLTAKTKQPARLVLEGKKLAEQLHASLSRSINVETDNYPSLHFNSNYSRFTETEKERIKEQNSGYNRKSGCLYCDCEKKNNCKLRIYATEYEIRNIRYAKNHMVETDNYPSLQRQHIQGNMWFEQAKCIRCGLCVYNSQNGFTFKNRGYGMQVVLPEENKVNISESLAEICPTGALYVK
jgi:predicted molibdopterin-dependent oxidoreductase YjgC